MLLQRSQAVWKVSDGLFKFIKKRKPFYIKSLRFKSGGGGVNRTLRLTYWFKYNHVLVCGKSYPKTLRQGHFFGTIYPLPDCQFKLFGWQGQKYFVAFLPSCEIWSDCNTSNHAPSYGLVLPYFSSRPILSFGLLLSVSVLPFICP